MKRRVITVIILLLFLAAVSLILLSSAASKERIGEILSKSLGGEVEIEDVSISPLLLLEIDGLTLRPGEPFSRPILRAGVISGRISLLSLLSLSPMVETIRVDRAEILIEESDDGLLNIATLEPVPSGGEAAWSSLILDDIYLRYEGARGGRSFLGSGEIDSREGGGFGISLDGDLDGLTLLLSAVLSKEGGGEAFDANLGITNLILDGNPFNLEIEADGLVSPDHRSFVSASSVSIDGNGETAALTGNLSYDADLLALEVADLDLSSSLGIRASGAGLISDLDDSPLISLSISDGSFPLSLVSREGLLLSGSARSLVAEISGPAEGPWSIAASAEAGGASLSGPVHLDGFNGRLSLDGGLSGFGADGAFEPRLGRVGISGGIRSASVPGASLGPGRIDLSARPAGRALDIRASFAGDLDISFPTLRGRGLSGNITADVRTGRRTTIRGVAGTISGGVISLDEISIAPRSLAFNLNPRRGGYALSVRGPSSFLGGTANLDLLALLDHDFSSESVAVSGELREIPYRRLVSAFPDISPDTRLDLGRFDLSGEFAAFGDTRLMDLSLSAPEAGLGGWRPHDLELSFEGLTNISTDTLTIDRARLSIDSGLMGAEASGEAGRAAADIRLRLLPSSIPDLADLADHYRGEETAYDLGGVIGADLRIEIPGDSTTRIIGSVSLDNASLSTGASGLRIRGLNAEFPVEHIIGGPSPEDSVTVRTWTDLPVNFTAETLAYSLLPVTDISGNMRLEGGVLRIEGIRYDLAGGEGLGSALLSTRDEGDGVGYALISTADGIDLRRLYEESQPFEGSLSGEAHMEIEISGNSSDLTSLRLAARSTGRGGIIGSELLHGIVDRMEDGFTKNALAQLAEFRYTSADLDMNLVANYYDYFTAMNKWGRPVTDEILTNISFRGPLSIAGPIQIPIEVRVSDMQLRLFLDRMERRQETRR